MNLATERRVFGYRRPNIAIAVLWLLAAAFPTLVLIGSKTGSAQFWLVVDAMSLAVVVTSLAFIIANLLKAFVERVILEGGKLKWITRFGKVGGVIPVEDIGRGSFVSASGFTNYYVPRNGNQKVQFAMGIKDQGWLMCFILEAAHGAGCPPPSPGPNIAEAVGNHKYSCGYLFSAIGWVFFSLFCSWIFVNALHSNQAEVSDKILSSFSPILSFCLALWWAHFLFEHIDLVDSRLTWKTWRGTRLDVSFDEITPGTMSWTKTPGGTWYEIQTTKGVLRWSSNIINSQILGFILRDLAQQSFLPLTSLFPSPDYASAQPIA